MSHRQQAKRAAANHRLKHDRQFIANWKHEGRSAARLRLMIRDKYSLAMRDLYHKRAKELFQEFIRTHTAEIARKAEELIASDPTKRLLNLNSKMVLPSGRKDTTL